MTYKHQHSHRKEHTKESVGNAAADLLADLYMKSTQSWLNFVKPLPLNIYSERYMAYDSQNDQYTQTPIRRLIRQRALEIADRKWKADSSQAMVKGNVKDFRTYIKRYKRKEYSAPRDWGILTRALTGVFAQPAFHINRDNTPYCQYCKEVREVETVNTLQHEANCRSNSDLDKQTADIESELLKTILPDFRSTTAQQQDTRYTDIIDMAQFQREPGETGKVFIGHNGQWAVCPDAKTLELTMTAYLRNCSADHIEIKASEYLEALIRTAEHTDVLNLVKVPDHMWKLIATAINPEAQVHTTASARSRYVENFHSLTEFDRPLRPKQTQPWTNICASPETVAEIETWIRPETACLTIVTPHTDENRMQINNIKASIIAHDLASNLALAIKKDTTAHTYSAGQTAAIIKIFERWSKGSQDRYINKTDILRSLDPNT